MLVDEYPWLDLLIYNNIWFMGSQGIRLRIYISCMWRNNLQRKGYAIFYIS